MKSARASKRLLFENFPREENYAITLESFNVVVRDDMLIVEEKENSYHLDKVMQPEYAKPSFIPTTSIPAAPNCISSSIITCKQSVLNVTIKFVYYSSIKENGYAKTNTRQALTRHYKKAHKERKSSTGSDNIVLFHI